MYRRGRRITLIFDSLENRTSLTLVPPLIVAANVFLTPDPVVTLSPWTPPLDIPPVPLGPAGPGAALNLQQKFDAATSTSTPFVALPVGQLD